VLLTITCIPYAESCTNVCRHSAGTSPASTPITAQMHERAAPAAAATLITKRVQSVLTVKLLLTVACSALCRVVQREYKARAKHTTTLYTLPQPSPPGFAPQPVTYAHNPAQPHAGALGQVLCSGPCVAHSFEVVPHTQLRAHNQHRCQQQSQKEKDTTLCLASATLPQPPADS
jgi:hypothetical protein